MTNPHDDKHYPLTDDGLAEFVNDIRREERERVLKVLKRICHDRNWQLDEHWFSFEELSEILGKL